MPKISRSKTHLSIKYERPTKHGIVEITRRVNLSGSKPIETVNFKDLIEIWYLEKGRQNYLINEQEYRLRGGDMLFIYPGETQGSGPYMKDRSTLYWTRFVFRRDQQHFLGLPKTETKKFIDDFLKIHPRILRADAHVKTLLERWITTETQGDEYKDILVRQCCFEFLHHCIKLARRLSHDTSPGIFRDLVTHIESEDPALLTSSKLARRYRLSASSLNQLFQRETGLTPHDYLLRYKIGRALDLLGDDSLTISAIAKRLGFSSSQYFATAFKRLNNLTPGQYREQRGHES